MTDNLPAALEPARQICLQELRRPYGRDPYWPKWDNHWWRLALLLELGALGDLPSELSEAFAQALDSHYLHHFPVHEHEVPAGCDPYGDILCFCALGTAARILFACGVKVWERLPWLYDWLFRYQLPDGGYNCDEQAYTGSNKSSLVSTAPVLEAVLASRPQGDFTAEERNLLNRGLSYLLAHRIYQSRSGRTLEPAWLSPLFPRFYEYDILRGLSLVSRLCETLRQPLPWPQVSEAFQLLQNQQNGSASGLQAQPWYLAAQTTLVPAARGEAEPWLRGQPVGLFGLLEQARQPAVASHYLAQEWQSLCRRLDRLRQQNLITGQ